MLSSSQMSELLTSDPVPEANLGYLFRLAHQRFRATLVDGNGHVVLLE